jgi:lactate dehydrogenase-like 2-hydroxyacid dehydrogenase
MSKPALISTGIMMPLVTRQINEAFNVHWLNEHSDWDKLFAEVGPSVEAVCTGALTNVPTTADMIKRLPNLKIISNYGVGYDSIDVPAAKAQNVVITHTPEVLNEEVADMAVGLLIATVREFNAAEVYLRSGDWPKQGEFRYTASLRDRHVGMIGFGRIGKAIGRRLEGFGVKLSYFGRTQQADVAYPFYDDLVAMARDVDTLIAILPGGPSTMGLINKPVLEALGPRGIVVNVARGSVVNEADLIHALKTRTIHGAGLDVYVNEPRIDPAFLELDNVTLLPHVGSGSQFTRDKMGQLTVDNLLAYKAGKPPLTPTPDTPFKGW